MNTFKTKKGIMGTLVTAGLGIVVLSVVAVLGIVMLGNMGASISKCEDLTWANSKIDSATYNQTTGYCCNATKCVDAASTGAKSSFYASGYVGSNSGGLLTYLPVIIPAIAVIGILSMLFGIWKFGGKSQGM